MLYPTAGARLFIADEMNPGITGAPSGPWVEILETEALGFLGSEWSMAEWDNSYIGMGDQGGEIVQEKQAIRRLPMQVVLGNDPSDPGQQLLWRAHHSTAKFHFRLLFADGVTERTWRGLVTAMTEVFDAANSVMRLQAAILPTIRVTRS